VGDVERRMPPAVGVVRPVRRALAVGYPVVLVADAHTSAGNDALAPPQVIAHHNATLVRIASFGPRVTTVRAAAFRLAAA
jgi:hypothetical protein